MPIVWSDGESIISHPRMCRCSFCKLDYSRGEAVKMEVDWIHRIISRRNRNQIETQAKPRLGQWRKFKKKKYSYIKKYDLLLKIPTNDY